MDQSIMLPVAIVAVVALAGLVVAVLAFVRVRAVSGRFPWASGKDAGSVDSLQALLHAVETNQRDLAQLRTAFDAAVVEARTHFKNMGIVRYNAFEGVAGQQSYSLCILNENQTGILISNLVGSNFSRGYAVEIKAGEPSRPLGDEEKAALAAAIKNGN